jgi:hypothetical protein
MCLIKCAFVGEKNFNIIKMHGTTIQINVNLVFPALVNVFFFLLIS